MALTTVKSVKTLGKFSLPIMAGCILQQLYTVVDAVIIGRCAGADGLAAVGVSGSIISFLTFIVFGFGIGMTVMLSKYYGTGDMDRFRQTSITALLCGLGFVTLLAILFIALSTPVLILFQTPAEIMAASRTYLVIMCFGLIFSFFYNFYNAALLSLGNSRTPFIILAFSGLVHVILTYVLAAVLGLGIFGAAIGTVTSQFLSAFLCFVYVKNRVPLMNFKLSELRLHKESVSETIEYCGASAFQQILFHGGKLLVQGAINTLGVNAIAGYNVAIQLEAFILSALEGVATSTSRHCAKNLGENKKDEVRYSLFAGIAISFTYTLVVGVIIWFFAPELVSIFVVDEEASALAEGVVYLKYMAFFYLAVSFAQIFQAFFRGIGRMNVAVWATVLQMIFRVGATYAFVNSLGIAAVSFGTLAGWIAMIIYEGILIHKYFRCDNHATHD